MIRLFRNGGMLGLLLAAGCQQTVTPPPLRSLAQSGELSLVCRDMTTGRGLDVNGCPDAYATAVEGHHTMLMVTQAGRGEVAVIDMTTRVVLDEDPTVPGTEFLPVGADPVSIVSTPGGASTFVATAEPGREAIFALPTSCIVAPSANQPPRDLTQWSACKLPSTPGEMTLLTDTALLAPGEYRHTCDGNGQNDVDSPSPALCPADWDAEQLVSPPGRRKILVTLPKLGGVAILDARNLFNQQPGTFEPCVIERWLPLTSTVPSGPQAQSIPSDLQAEITSCPVTPRYSFGPPPTALSSQPAGIALKDNQLFVADLGAPLVHILDVNDPCDPYELPPLLPSSYDEPARMVLTSRVAVSDLTKDGHRYAYAVDDGDGSLMAFDLTPSSTQRTPILRPGSPYLPFDSPDRIKTNLQNARVLDLMFLTHDVPILDPGTQAAVTGQLCDPLPGDTGTDTEYRTSSDYTRGASPSKLRGTFGVVALSNGQIGVVNIEDWDAPCRRPTEANASSAPDWRGCKNDGSLSYVDSSGTRTVSDESSCNVVESHHARSGRFFANNSTVGTGAPSLLALPTLTSVAGNISTGGSLQANSSPKLLAVPFPDSAIGNPKEYSEVFVGTSQYFVCPASSDVPSTNASCTLPAPNNSFPTSATLLSSAPATAANNSLLLPQVEPRAYLPSESFSVTFEGKLFDDRQTGLLSGTDLTLSDPDANFCDQGVHDLDAASVLASEFVSNDPQLSAAQQATFGPFHADFVQITSDFSDNDSYWVTPVGSACATDTGTGIGGITGCRNYFGTTNNFTPNREWTIVQAFQDHLTLQPRAQDANGIDNLHCCFPGTVTYTVRPAHQWLLRGQQPLTNVVVGAGARCVVDECDPRKAHLKNRIIRNLQ